MGSYLGLKLTVSPSTSVINITSSKVLGIVKMYKFLLNG